MNDNHLKARMTLYGDNINDLSLYLHMHRNTLIHKLKCNGFKQIEIKEIIKRYNLTNEEIRLIFFEDGVINGKNIYHQSC